MKPALTLSEKPAWLTAPALHAVMTALGGRGLPVGGCVRNTLLGTAVQDVDIATPLTPAEVMAKAELAGLKVIPTGVDHGTVTVVSAGQAFEVTTLRVDQETDGRHAVVTFTDDWAADAARRDFTLNALYMDLDGHVYDPLGTGVADLKARRICFIGHAEDRIAEDYLRILRFFRFYAWYGVGAADEAAVKACAAQSSNLKSISPERITHEMLKLCMADDPAPTLKLMLNNNILHELIVKKVEYSFNQPKSGVDYLGVLWAACGKNAAQLKLSNDQKRTIEVFDKFDKDTPFNAVLFLYGVDVARTLFALFERPSEREAALNATMPIFPLETAVVMQRIGLNEGAALGKILKDTKQWWLAENCVPDAEACLTYAAARV